MVFCLDTETCEGAALPGFCHGRSLAVSHVLRARTIFNCTKEKAKSREVT